MKGNHLAKPKNRSRIRRFIGQELFIIKRKLLWLFSNQNFAEIDTNIQLPYLMVQHKSLLLRPLKNVEMYLQHNKIHNLNLALSKIDGVVIYPRQTFSVWKLVGRPTAFKGYLEGLVLENGTISKGIGGGLCQLGNMIYWMALHTPLTIKERWRHGYDVFPDINRTIPFACGATLAYNYIDLQLENNTDKAFQIHLWLDDTHLCGEIRSLSSNLRYEIYETDSSIQQQWWGGYTRHNKIWRKITHVESNLTENELISENTAIMMYSPLIDRAPNT